MTPQKPLHAFSPAENGPDVDALPVQEHVDQEQHSRPYEELSST